MNLNFLCARRAHFFLAACLLLWGGVSYAGAGNGQPIQPIQAEQLFELPLEQLAQVAVQAPAAITSIKSLEVPASTTVISAEDIARSSARNIFDLVETYVPGAIWMNSESGPLLGIRGGVPHRNVSYLLVVNDRVLNSKAHYGVKSELEQWNLSDIKEIVVIRGSGSVTYGPGAISGVIKITTHDASSVNKGELKLSAVYPYDGFGFEYQDSVRNNDWDAYWYLSAQRTQGDDSPHYIVADNTEFGYIGSDLETNTRPLDYFADYQDNPQIKAHFQSHFNEHYTLWVRYTQQGSTWRGNEAKTEFNGKLENQQSVRDRQFVITLRQDKQLSEQLKSSTIVSFDSFDAERRGGSLRDPDPDHPLNFKNDFSERELFLRSAINWKSSEQVEIAAGIEYSYDHFGAGWGDDKKDFRLGDNDNIVNSPNSRAVRGVERGSATRDGPAIYVGNGWETDTYSLFAETNASMGQGWRSLVSLRVDKNTYSDYLWSPRVALIKNLSGEQYLKLIAQQAQRINTAAQVYVDSVNNVAPENETLKGVELAYSADFTEGSKINASFFYNKHEYLSYSTEEDVSQILGNLKFYGLELDFHRKLARSSFGLNYSFVKQRDWDLKDGVEFSGVSYADYNVDLEDLGTSLTGTGNDLNNWANQYLKSYFYYDLQGGFSLNVDARYYWDMQGARDGIAVIEDALAGTSEEADLQLVLADLEEKNVYEPEFRLNASISYRPNDDIFLGLYFQNLISTNDNKRYAEDTGNNRASPRRVRFVEEPRMISVKFGIQF